METLLVEDVNNKKVRLEFGNPDHIKLAKESIIPEGLNNYKVTFDVWGSVDIIVDAKDEEEAEKFANDKLDLDCLYINTTVKKLSPK